MTLTAPPYTAVQDRLTAVTFATAKEELGISGTALDARLTRWVASAKERADRYLNNPFWRRSSSAPYDYLDPAEELPLPNSITDFVYDYCAYMVGGASRTGIVRSERTRDLARTYRTASEAFEGLERLHLRAYRLLPGLSAGGRDSSRDPWIA